MSAEGSFSDWCRALVNANFRRVVSESEGEWMPILVGGPTPDKRTYRDLQPAFEEHGKDLVLEGWAPTQVEVEGWTEAALIAAAWFAPLRGPRPSEHPKRTEVVYLVAFVRGQRPEAWKAPIVRRP